jgi:hypothetical protein
MVSNAHVEAEAHRANRDGRSSGMCIAYHAMTISRHVDAQLTKRSRGTLQVWRRVHIVHLRQDAGRVVI